MKKTSPQYLAFVGDAVFDLIVRENLVRKFNEPVGKLNNKKIEKVCCQAQAKMIDLIFDELTDEEKVIYKRGRNMHVSQIPKNASHEEYHKATGFEVLLGYLYLSGNNKRINEIMLRVLV